MNHPIVSIDSEHSTAVFSLDDFELSADGSLEPKSLGGSVIEADNNNGEEVYKAHDQNTGLQSSSQNGYVTTAVARKKCPKRRRKSKSSGITYDDLVPHFGQPRREVAETFGVSLSTFNSLRKKFRIPIWPCTKRKTGPMAKMGNVPRVMPMFEHVTSELLTSMTSKTSTSQSQITVELKGKQALPMQDETEYLDGIGYQDMEMQYQYPDKKTMMGYHGNQELDGMPIIIVDEMHNFLLDNINFDE